MDRKCRIVLIVALFYLVYISLFLAKFEFNPSAAIELSDNYVRVHNVTLPSNLVVQIDSDGYDGQIYYTMAADISNEILKIDAFRYQRILYPLLALLLSFGITPLLPITLLAISYFSVILGTYILLLILEKHKLNLNLAFLWALNVGFFISIIRDLADPLMFLFLLVALYFFENRKHVMSGIFLTFAVLTKEYAVSFILPLVAYYFIIYVFNRKSNSSFSVREFFFRIKEKYAELFIYMIPLFIFLLWQLFVFLKTGDLPITDSNSRFGLPLAGLTSYLSTLNFPASLIDLYVQYAVLFVVCFLLWELYILLKTGMFKLHPYLLILLAQVAIILSFDYYMYSALIDSMGRMAMGLFLFSILYSARQKEKYFIPLLVLMILMSGSYFIVKIILFNPGYFVT